MSEAADKLRFLAREARCFAQQVSRGSREEALLALATLYESQAGELDRSDQSGPPSGGVEFERPLYPPVFERII